MTATELLATAQDVRAKLVAIRDAVPVPTPVPDPTPIPTPVPVPVPTPTGLQPWQVRKMPTPVGSPTSIIRAPLGYPAGPTGVMTGGAKHSTMLAINGRMYVFGGDYSGYCTAEDRQAMKASDDFRNGCFSYGVATDDWRLEQSWDCGEGKIQPWRPDWGHFCWDTKRKVVWFWVSGSTGAYTNTGSFWYKQALSTGLTFAYGDGRLYPDTLPVPAGSLTLPDNATTRVYYDPIAHAVNLISGLYPLYDVTTAGGKITSAVNLRPYWMTYGDPMDNIDPRHYADPGKLLCLDVTTMTWTDPGLPKAEDQTPHLTMPDGRVWSNYYHNMTLAYDEEGDQLVSVGNAYTIHFSFATQTWTRYLGGVTGSTLFPPGQAQINLDFCRGVIVPGTRKLWIVEASHYGDRTKAYGWSYHLDNHVYKQEVGIQVQQGTCLWDGADGLAAGTPVGAAGETVCPVIHDADILWWLEHENRVLNPYQYGGSGRVIAVHAWHYKTGVVERIVPPYADTTDHPHGLVWGFDPVNRMLLGYGQNVSVYSDPVTAHPNLYCWPISGFTS